MDLSEIKEVLAKLSGCKVISDAPLKEYTSFKIGGPADLLVEPENSNALQQVMRILAEHNQSYFVLGKGSNILIGDKGFRGVVLRLTGLNNVRSEGTKIIAESGVTLAKLAGFAVNAELTGLEFASGIPGTLGGAVVMNAGAYGGEMRDVVTRVTALTPHGEMRALNAREMEFGYRQSIFQKNGWIVVEVEMELQPGDSVEIRDKMNELNSRRKNKQPLEYPSAGSTFKRPPGYFAGTLIDQMGLKGYTIGGAQVSEKHAGFIINVGGARASDVLKLIQHVQKQVKAKAGVDLEPEVHLVGEFDKQDE